MVLVELFVGSSLYSGGLLAKYYSDCEDLRRKLRLKEAEAEPESEKPQKFVEFAVERVEQDPPMYVNTGGNHPGLLVPIGGGSHTEMRRLFTGAISPEKSLYNWTITDLDGRPCTLPRRFWMNTPDDLKTYLESNRIPSNLSPLSLPMQVCEIDVPRGVRVYGVPEASVAGTNLERVVRAAVRPRTIGQPLWRAAVAVAAGTGVGLWLTWRDQKRWHPAKAWPDGVRTIVDQHTGI
jgi:hypothetical protein